MTRGTVYRRECWVVPCFARAVVGQQRTVESLGCNRANENEAPTRASRVALCPFVFFSLVFFSAAIGKQD